MIDRTKPNFSLSNCTTKSLRILIKNAKNLVVIDKLLTFKDMEQDLKDELINRILEIMH